MIKKIAVTDVVLGMYLVEIHGSWLHHPFWKSNFLLEDPEDLSKLKSSGVPSVSVDLSRSKLSDSKPRPRPESREKPAITELRPAPAEKRTSFESELRHARRLCEQSQNEVLSMFSEARMGQAVPLTRAAQVVEEINSSVTRQPQALITLARLKTSDNYTYMHSVAVSALMIALARELNLDDGKVRVAGMAGLLHDVGKMAVPDAILNKPGKLTDEEFALVKSHPVKGAEILERSSGVDDKVIEVCLHHHEKFDGSGYPNGQAANQISVIARMAAVCDVYDAITSDRPYKKGWPPSESIQRMVSWSGHFDPKILQAFIKVVGIYPVGSLVRLKSQRLAVVIAQSEGSLLKPVVKVFFSTRTQLPLPQQILDLSKSSVDDAIECREPLENWNFPYLNDLWQEAG
ncbi:HD-GYP domain-containing protein [Pseudohongiella sp. SYSU M77423]|uniref:HD-GYP domain-containing protein n=1 Tax=Pseudohongiella sp. SYSU M77423 TaxID=3042312 RepID=UPI00248149C9|nr:HD-GYP domain-containing protein [Pseudohongiella sp. SYSU M77423]MDH7944153.1 HD-GYP domain-containing protein [Pseudohongiella sp. SYSU M77423]MEC8859359.1 HD-GYP domain-containing protein [Pseudomonadota bacterium]